MTKHAEPSREKVLLTKKHLDHMFDFLLKTLEITPDQYGCLRKADRTLRKARKILTGLVDKLCDGQAPSQPIDEMESDIETKDDGSEIENQENNSTINSEQFFQDTMQTLEQMNCETQISEITMQPERASAQVQASVEIAESNHHPRTSSASTSNSSNSSPSIDERSEGPNELRMRNDQEAGPTDLELSAEEISSMYQKSPTIRDFAVSLLSRLFDESELTKISNGQQRLDPERIKYIRQIVEQEAGSGLVWASCMESIRRKFYHLRRASKSKIP